MPVALIGMNYVSCLSFSQMCSTLSCLVISIEYCTFPGLLHALVASFSECSACLFFGTCSLHIPVDLKMTKRVSQCGHFLFLSVLEGIGLEGETFSSKHFYVSLVSHPFNLFSVELLVRDFYSDTGHCNITGSGETWCWKWEARECVRNCCSEVQLLPCWESLSSSCLGIYPFGELWLPGQLCFGVYILPRKQEIQKMAKDVLHIKSFSFGWMRTARGGLYKCDMKSCCLFLVFFFRASCTWREEKLLSDDCST